LVPGNSLANHPTAAEAASAVRPHGDWKSAMAYPMPFGNSSGRWSDGYAGDRRSVLPHPDYFDTPPPAQARPSPTARACLERGGSGSMASYKSSLTILLSGTGKASTDQKNELFLGRPGAGEAR